MITLTTPNRPTHEMTKTVASTSTPSKSSSTSTSSSSLQNFESELSTLVNDALQAAGISPSQATFSFNPAANTPASVTTTTASAEDSAAPATTQAATTTAQAPAATLIAPFAASTASATSTTSAATTTSASSATATPSTPVVLSPATDPVVGTEGLIYNPSMESFGGLGAAPITSSTMWKDPFSGQSYSADLILAGYQKAYGSDYNNMVGALVGRWGENAYDSALELDPTLVSVDANPNAGGPKTLFEKYGAYGSFTDPTTGKASYFDANGSEYATGTGPAVGMFTSMGKMTGAALSNRVAV